MKCCNHNPPNLPPDGEAYSTRYCRICWLRAHRDGWKELCGDQPPAPLPLPVPYPDWPAWVKAVATRKQEGEAGAGDTIKRVLTTLGVDWFFKQFVVRFVGDCGCEARRRNYNALYPYER